nr:hypothetical protein [Tanacetum cinerariifolium]
MEFNLTDIDASIANAFIRGSVVSRGIQSQGSSGCRERRFLQMPANLEVMLAASTASSGASFNPHNKHFRAFPCMV